MSDVSLDQNRIEPKKMRLSFHPGLIVNDVRELAYLAVNLRNSFIATWLKRPIPGRATPLSRLWTSRYAEIKTN